MDQQQPISADVIKRVLASGEVPVEINGVHLVVMSLDARKELHKTIADDSSLITETYEAQQTALASVWDDAELDQYTDQDGSPIQ